VTADDFTVLDKGKPQKVSVFTEWSCRKRS
jgi:hypothetical protein